MADWPTVTELAQVLDVENVADWGDTLDRVMEAAIARVKLDVGNWEEYDDVPDEMLAAAALRMAELISLRPSSTLLSVRQNLASGLDQDPTYQRLLFGHRRSFGFA